MEQLVGKLLADFEQGRITRRELVKSIAIAATALTAVPASAAVEPAFKATAVNHISYSVADYARTRDFYQGLFGMNISHDDGHQCYMEFGATHLIPRNGRAGAVTPRVDHIAYTIDPWTKKQLKPNSSGAG